MGTPLPKLRFFEGISSIVYSTIQNVCLLREQNCPPCQFALAVCAFYVVKILLVVLPLKALVGAALVRFAHGRLPVQREPHGALQPQLLNEA